MRDIEFRGKRVDNGEWVYGDLWQCKYADGRNKITISEQTPCALCNIEVIPETVGQYTGLRDRNEVKIYEKDIVRTNKGIMVIKYLKDSFQCIDNNDCNYRLFDFIYNGCIKVIGNIYGY